ncbi:hypothetical protein [Streptomyces sp. URMC 123]|uniref:hypothetical protein n=1 Tax=Streptomyces sp. URMC 123 TaxID=3423403 RepID=UPI003F1AECF9
MAISAAEAEARKAAIADAEQERSWHAVGTFATLEDVAVFVNAPPAQGPGEVVLCCHDGVIEVMIYM